MHEARRHCPSPRHQPLVTHKLPPCSLLTAACPKCKQTNHRYELLLPKRSSLRHRIPGADAGFLDFVTFLLTPDPRHRPSAADALQHPWLQQVYPPIDTMLD